MGTASVKPRETQADKEQPRDDIGPHRGTYPHDVLRSTSPHLAVPGDRPKVAVGLGGEMRARPICAETGSMWRSMRSAPRAFSGWGGALIRRALHSFPSQVETARSGINEERLRRLYRSG